MKPETCSIYFNPRCNTCRNALEILKKKKADVKIIEYLKTPPTYEQLDELLKMLKIEPEELIRRKEKIYQEKYEGKKLSRNEWIQAMVENPIFIQRPIVIKGTKAIIGRPAEKVLEIF